MVSKAKEIYLVRETINLISDFNEQEQYLTVDALLKVLTVYMVSIDKKEPTYGYRTKEGKTENQ